MAQRGHPVKLRIIALLATLVFVFALFADLPSSIFVLSFLTSIIATAAAMIAERHQKREAEEKMRIADISRS
jgi:hypothetical protein